MKTAWKRKLFQPRTSARTSGIETFLFAFFNAAMNFAKSVIIASRYGASATSDAYYASVNILNAPAGLLSDSLTALVLPRYVDRKRNNEEAVFLSSYLSTVLISFLSLSLIFIVFGHSMAGAVLQGFSGETLGTVDRLILLSIPTIVFTPLIVVLDSALRAEQFFIYGNLGSAANSFMGFLLLLFLSRIGVAGIVVASVSGVLINFGILAWITFRKGMLRGPINLAMGLREARAALPLLAGGLLGVGASYIEKYFTSFLDAGTMTVLNMGGSLIGVAQGLLVGALIGVYYPFISTIVVAGDTAGYEELVKKARSLIVGLLGLAVACMIGFSRPVLSLLFEHGRFEAAAVTKLAQLFCASTFGIMYAAFANLGGFTFYAKGDTKRPVLISIFTSLLGSVILQAILVKPLGALGIVEGRCIANAANLFVMALILSRSHGFKLLGAKETLLVLGLLVLSLGAGFLEWSPWFILLPPSYYFLVSLGLYGIKPVEFLALVRGNRDREAIDDKKG